MQQVNTSDSNQPAQDSEPSANELSIKRASRAAIASLLNLTFLPVIGFIWLLIIGKEAEKEGIDGYHFRLGLKINLSAAFALLVVTALIMLAGGLDSAYTWIYVINYFTLVHTIFIIAATWAMARAWSGQKLWG